MSQYDELNRIDRASEDQAERLYERRRDALQQIRTAAAMCAAQGEPMWGIQCPLGYILANTLASSESRVWIRNSDMMLQEGYEAVQISAEDAKRIEDFSDGSEPREKWQKLSNGNYILVPV